MISRLVCMSLSSSLLVFALLGTIASAETDNKDVITVTCTDFNDPLNGCSFDPVSASLKEIIRTIKDVNQCDVAQNQANANCSTNDGALFSCQKNGSQATCVFPGKITVECDEISDKTATCKINKPNKKSIVDAMIAVTPNFAVSQEISRVLSEVCLEEEIATNLKRDCRLLIDLAFSDKSADKIELANILDQISPSAATVAFDTAKISGKNQIRSLNNFLSLQRLQKLKEDKNSFRFNRYENYQSRKIWFGTYHLVNQEESTDSIFPDSFSQLGVFFNASFGKNKKATDRTELGFTGDTIDITSGIDYAFSSKLNLGSAFGFSQSENSIDLGRGKLDFTSFSLLLFGIYYPSQQSYVNLVFSYGGSEYDQNRRIRFSQTDVATNSQTTVNQVAHADYFGNQLLAELALGMNHSLAGISVDTSAHLVFSQVKINNFREQMSDPNAIGSGWGLQFDTNKSNSTIFKLGSQANYAWSNVWGVLLPQIGIYWNKELSTAAETIRGSFAGDPNKVKFTLPSNKLDSNYFEVKTAITALLPHGRMVFLSYQTLLAFDDYETFTFTGGVRLEL